MASEQATNRHGNPLVFDELRWVIQIRHSLQEDGDDGDDDDGIPVSVFNVPKQLQVIKPEAYTPQFIALGPYHHWRQELYEMERYKLAAARRTQKHLHSVKLDHLVDQFTRLERKIRAYYHRYLDFNGETLSWMMVVDGSFLLEFLQIYAADEGGKVLRRISSRMSHLVDFTGRKSAHNLILRDMMMLENQIPLFLLRKIVDPQCASSQEAGELLTSMLTGLMKELCPFKMMASFPTVDPAKHAHLLEMLYSLLVPKPPEEVNGGVDDNYDIEEQPAEVGSGAEEKPAAGFEYVKQLFGAVWGMMSDLNTGPMKYVTKPIAFAVKAPWKMLTVVPGFSAMKQPVESFFMSRGDGSSYAKDTTTVACMSRPPLVEEIMIPSVSELVNAGVNFAPTDGDISTTTFDPKTVTLFLPVVSLDCNTEVVLRNLVAYEASAVSGPVVLTRYTELMNGIIDTDEDVALLRQRGVVLNRMKSDGEVAKLWNGMSKSVRLTKVPFLDKVIEDVNRYYDGRWRVKTKKFMRKYVFSSWQLLTFLAAILMLLLTTLQAFCSVYTCSRWFGDVVTVKKV